MENEHYAGKRREGKNENMPNMTCTRRAGAALAKYEKTADTLPQARWFRELVFAEVVRLECAGQHWPVGHEVLESLGLGFVSSWSSHNRL